MKNQKIVNIYSEYCENCKKHYTKAYFEKHCKSEKCKRNFHDKQIANWEKEKDSDEYKLWEEEEEYYRKKLLGYYDNE